MSVDMNDPRVWEFRNALADVDKGLRAPADAHERYKRAIGPYLEFMSEFCPADSPARRHLMAALFHESHLPLGAIAVAFRAADEEVEWIRTQNDIHRGRFMASLLWPVSQDPHCSVRKATLER